MTAADIQHDAAEVRLADGGGNERVEYIAH
jgi:hypothetical protein